MMAQISPRHLLSCLYECEDNPAYIRTPNKRPNKKTVHEFNLVFVVR